MPPRPRGERAKSVRGITPEMLRFLAESARDTLPNEFYARLIAQDGIITEFSIIRVIAGRTQVIPFTHEEPPDINLQAVGTCHSHPSGSFWPSDADLDFFKRTGHTHIIYGYPFNERSWQAYNMYGEVIELPVVKSERKRHYL